jgi:tRNA-splicing ligase RtcB
LFKNIPCGIGSKRKDLKLNTKNERQVLLKGAEWAISQGFGTDQDLQHIEEQGCLAGANPYVISKRAYERGRPQLGTLGSGNHFVEIDYVEEVYNPHIASVLGLEVDSIAVIVHTGSRGLGYQVCDDFLQQMMKASRKYGIELPDRQLCCAPICSEEGQRYFSAMACAANYAFTNRQIITHWVRETFERVLQMSPRDLQMNLVYDVAHNIAKFESHVVSGNQRRVCVHRKGATRAFPPGHPAVPEAYRTVGQPVLIPGDMGRCSYVLVGTDEAMKSTFGSTCHGAGRMLSRNAAKKQAKGRAIWRELEDQGIIVRSDGRSTLAEEMPEAYKNVSDVVEVVHNAGISRKVVKLRPLGVIKG